MLRRGFPLLVAGTIWILENVINREIQVLNMTVKYENLLTNYNNTMISILNYFSDYNYENYPKKTNNTYFGVKKLDTWSSSVLDKSILNDKLDRIS